MVQCLGLEQVTQREAGSRVTFLGHPRYVNGMADVEWIEFYHQCSVLAQFQRGTGTGRQNQSCKEE